jgi:hypothetical protein
MRELTDVPFGGLYSVKMEVEGSEPTIDTLQHLSRHPNKINEKDLFWLDEYMNRVRRYNTTRH